MEIKVAKHAGFCFGVKRAINIAEQVASKSNDKTYVPGQIVHNERVIEDLESKGVVFLNGLDELPENSTTVLRAHGEPIETYTKLREKRIETSLTDATCPLVTLVHNVAKKLVVNGYEVVLFGKNDHPESIGTRSHIKGEGTFIVESPDDYLKLIDHAKNFDKVAIISQTTMSVEGYKRLIDNVNSKLDSVFEEIPLALNKLDVKFGFVDTICQPTKLRQSDTIEVTKESDVVIVIGGKNSSNTKELLATCKKLGKEAYMIQDAGQLENGWFSGKEIVGVTAGASTPDITINEVVERIKGFD
tara:strand:- start:6598 stop:7503 length:906 start_codon:yes stop_codon:yes gene_type:complete